MKSGFLGLALALVASAALAGQPVTIVDKTNSNAAGVTGTGEVKVDCTTGCSGGGSVTVSSPLGRQADASSVSTALSTEDVAILNAATPAGTNYVGQVGSAVVSPTVTPTISTSAYTAGYLFSLPMSFTVTNTGAIANASVTFNTGTYTSGIDLLLFNAALTGSYSANSALALTQTDMGKYIGVLHLTDCRATGTASTSCGMLYQSQFYKLSGSTTIIYGVPVILAAATFTNATDAVFELNQVQ